MLPTGNSSNGIDRSEFDVHKCIVQSILNRARSIFSLVLIALLVLNSSLVFAEELFFRPTVINVGSGQTILSTTAGGSLIATNEKGVLLSNFPVAFENEVIISSPLVTNFDNQTGDEILLITRDAADTYKVKMLDLQSAVLKAETTLPVTSQNGEMPVHEPTVYSSAEGNYLIIPDNKGRLMEYTYKSGDWRFRYVGDVAQTTPPDPTPEPQPTPTIPEISYEPLTTLGQKDANNNAISTANLAGGNTKNSANSFFLPGGAEIDQTNHRLFVADTENNRVLIFNLDQNNQPLDNNADFVLGQADFTTTTGRLTAAGMRLPQGLSYDYLKNWLYVADSGNSRILIFDLAEINSGEAAIHVLGQPDFNANATGASPSGFISIENVKIDVENQRLFAADTWGARLLIFDVAEISNGEAAINVLGQPNFTSTAIATTASGFRRPKGLAIDNTKNLLYVSDRTNSRVLIFDIAEIANGEAAINVLGQTNFTAPGAGTSAAKFNFSFDLDLDETSQRLFVSDEINRRVLVFDVAEIVNGEATTNVIGQLDFNSNSLSDPTNANFGTPQGVVFDEISQTLFVTDRFFNRLVMFDLETIVDGEAAIGVLGQTDESDTPNFATGHFNNSSTSPASGFAYNTGMALDTVSHRLFVSDSYSSRVLVFNLNSENQLLDQNADFVLGQSSLSEVQIPDYLNLTGSDIGQPAGLAFDETKNLLYVADRISNRVLVFDTTAISNGEAAIHVLGQSNFSDTAESTTASGLYFPQGLSLDSQGQRLFVADEYNTRILIFDVDTVNNGEPAINVLGQTDFVSLDAATTAGGLNYPLDVKYYKAQNWLFVADSYNNRVVIYDVADINNGEAAIHVLGQSSFTASEEGVGANKMKFPAGLGIDNLKKLLYVSDGNSRVMVFNLDNLTSGQDAQALIGQPNFSSSGAKLPTSEDLNLSDYLNFDGALYYEHIKPVIVDETHERIFISESFNHRVSTFEVLMDENLPYAQEVITAIGQYDEQGNTSFTSNLANNHQQSGRNSLFLPNDGDIDELNHRLFVADTENNRVLVFNLDQNNQLTDRNADYVLGQPDFRTTTARLTVDGLRLPTDASYDPATNRLFVADSGNTRVLIFDVAEISSGEPAVNVLGQPDFVSNDVGAAQSGFQSAEAVKIDAATQKLFVSDTWGARILVFDVTAITNGEAATNVLGQANFTATGIATSASGMRRPKGLAIDSAKNLLYVADRTNNRILVFNIATISNGEAAVSVLGQANFTGQAAATAANRLNFPADVTLNQDGSLLFVADEQNRRILTFDVSAITNGENATNVLGFSDFTSAGSNPTDNKNFGLPEGVIFNKTTNTLFVTDRFLNRVAIFDLNQIDNGEPMVNLLGHTDQSGSPVFNNRNVNNATLADRGFVYNTGIAMDMINHRLFVSDSFNARVLVFNLNENNDLVDKTADYVLGQTDFDNDYFPDYFNPQPGDIAQPAGLSFDPMANRLFVADRSLNRILVFDTATITNGEDAIHVLGQNNFSEVTENTSPNGLYYPQGLSLDVSGRRLFVSDEYNTRVLVFDIAAITNGEDAINVLGQPDFVSAIADTTVSNLNYPLDVAYYSQKNWLFVADSYNNRIMVYDVSSITNGENAIRVLGQSDFNSADAAAQANKMNYPAGLGVDNARKLLYVSDGNSRVLIFNLTTIENGENAVGLIGQPDFSSSGAMFPAIDNVNLTDHLNFEGATYYEHIKPIFVNENSGRIYVSESFNHRISVFDVPNIGDDGGEGPGSGTGYDPGVPAGEYFATTATVASGKLYSTKYGNKLNIWTLAADTWSLRALDLPKKIIYPVAVRNGGEIYAISADNQLYAWDDQNLTPISGFPVQLSQTPISAPKVIDLAGDEKILIEFVDGQKILFNLNGQVFGSSTKITLQTKNPFTNGPSAGAIVGAAAQTGWEIFTANQYLIRSLFSHR